MRPLHHALGAASALLLALAPISAGAHEYWLAPSQWQSRPGRTIAVLGVAGTGFRGEPKPFDATRCVRFTARAARTLDLSRVAVNGELTWARFAPADTGGAMLAFESDFTPITLAAPEFDAYLALEGLDAALAARRTRASRTPGRERYRRCAKAWLAGGDAARALAPAGMPLEIVPLAPPGAGPLLAVRVLRGGRPLPGALVRAWRTSLADAGSPVDPADRDSVGIVWSGRTDAVGVVAVPLAGRGEWLVSAVHMEPSRDPSADWESTWASLTFARLARERER